MSREVITADEFLSSPKMARQKFDVPVPELGEGKVIPIWGMTPRERSEFEDSRSKWAKANKHQMRERIVFECARNDDGVKLFTIDQIEKLAQLRGDVFERLVNVAVDLSGFTAADLETLTKNSEASHSV